VRGGARAGGYDGDGYEYDDAEYDEFGQPLHGGYEEQGYGYRAEGAARGEAAAFAAGVAAAGAVARRRPKQDAFAGRAADNRRLAANRRRADARGGKVHAGRDSVWSKGHESATATFLNSLSPGEIIKTDGYLGRVVSVLRDHSGGLPRIEVTYPTEPEYGVDVVLGSTVEVPPYAMTQKNCTVADFTVTKVNRDMVMKIFKFLDKDDSGSLDLADFSEQRSTRSSEWLL
jgi:hypothetical protein